MAHRRVIYREFDSNRHRRVFLDGCARPHAGHLKVHQLRRTGKD